MSRSTTPAPALPVPALPALQALLGSEHDSADIGRALRSAVRSLNPAAVGALLLHCSDESEQESAEVFQRTFAQEALPRLKYGSRVPFHMANPGARYEWGAARIAEQHFATPESAAGFKVVVAKVNGHVATVHSGADGYTFGSMERYGAESTYCGAVHALLDGSDLPFAEDLADALRSEGRDRVAELAQVEPRIRPFFGALVSARIQARHLVQDVQDYVPTTPTVYVVLFGVTLNKPGPDSELPGGLYVIDRRTAQPDDRYIGLGDDVRAYRLETDGGRLRVVDPELETERVARDHRELARRRLATLPRDAAERRAAAEVVRRVGGDHAKARAVLGPLLGGLMAVAPLPVALVLAAEGASAIHLLHRLHQATDEGTQRRHAQDVIASVQRRIEELPPEEADRVAARLIEVLGSLRASSSSEPAS